MNFSYTIVSSGLRVSMYAWMYCDIPYNNEVVPEKCLPYNEYIVEADDVDWFGDQLFNAAIDLEEGFDLTMVYFNNIDHLGHANGPAGAEVYEGIMQVDEKLGDLFATLDVLDLRSETNIIIVSDHGMVGNIPTKFERLTDYVDGELIDKSVAPGIHTMIALKDTSNADQVVDDLASWEGVDAYKREDIPEHFHYKDSEYALDVLVVASLGHQIADDDAFADSFVPTAGPNEDDEPRKQKNLFCYHFYN